MRILKYVEMKNKTDLNAAELGAKTDENERPWSELTDDEKVDIVARKIMQKYKEAFKELPK